MNNTFSAVPRWLQFAVVMYVLIAVIATITSFLSDETVALVYQHIISYGWIVWLIPVMFMGCWFWVAYTKPAERLASLTLSGMNKMHTEVRNLSPRTMVVYYISDGDKPIRLKKVLALQKLAFLYSTLLVCYETEWEEIDNSRKVELPIGDGKKGN